LAKKVFIKSYGCQMNVYDSDRMADVLATDGFERVEEAAGADLVILNTCHIREKAAEKVYSELGRLRELKDQGVRIAVAGCVAQAEGSEIQRRAPYVDLVVGPQSFHRLPELLARADDKQGGKSTGAGIVDTDFPVESKFLHLPDNNNPGPSAFLTVQEGCDKFCAFCVVPYTRGAEYSRPDRDVLEEARRLVDAGTREITLLGQNVNAYHGAEGGLAGLIRDLARIGGLQRIRYTTSHPRDMDEDLIRVHGDVPELMPYLHLPVQSGSDRVLAKMNRQHSADDYRKLVERLRQSRPDLALSSDFIVGHPGETEQDFEQTLSLIRDIGYSQAYSFKYSRRPGTPAADSDGQVDEAEKAERLARLQELLNAQQQAFNDKFVGTVMPVLFDREGRQPAQAAGRGPWMQAVHVTCQDRAAAAALIGTVGTVRILASHARSLTGQMEAPALAVAIDG
jgi:tRNA-2-methylthio-N6-dimethylallyladenosine synthase